MTDIATIDGWHVFQQRYIATMEDRTKLRNAGVLVYIEMLIDGIAVDYPDKNLPCEQLVLLSEVLKKVSLILRECCHQPTESIKTINGKLPNIIKGISFQPIESVKTVNGRTERAYHCDNWEIEWRKLR